MSGRKHLDMTTGALMPKIIRFTIPLALTGLLQLVYNAADMMVVGRFAGSTSLAAVGATSMLVNLTINLFMGISMGAGVTVAKYIGAGDGQRVSRAVHTTILLGLVSGAIVMTVGLIFSPQFLKWMSTPDDIISLSILYLRIYFMGAPANMLYNFGAAVLRANGDSKRPFYFLTSAGILNIVLNLVFVIKFHMDVAGVAYATIISQYISAICVIIALMNDNGFIRLSIKKLRFWKSELTEILLIGLPAGIQGSLFSISNVMIQSSINSFGSTVIAGNTAAANIDNIVYVCCNAVSQAAMTFSSQNYGAKKYGRISKTYSNCIGLSLLIMAGLCTPFYIFKSRLLGIFTTDPNVIAAGNIRLTIFMTTYFLDTLMDVTTGQLRGLGKSIGPMAITLAGVVGFRTIWLFTVFRSHHTLEMLYYSYPISWIITVIALMTCYICVYRKNIKPFIHKKNEVTE